MKSLKKSVFVFMTIAVIACLFTVCGVSAYAESDITDYLTYEINDGNVTITYCDSAISGDIVIPDTIEGYPVTTIGDGAFADYCVNITSLVIPESITKIGINAFYTCVNMKTVVLPESLTVLPSGIFGDCWSLENVNIPSGVKSIPNSAFAGCHSLSEISIPAGVISIKSGAFLGTAIKEICLPEGLQEIGEGAFSNCYKLEQINIPDGVKIIDGSTFSRCLSLEKIDFPNELTEIGDYAFECCYSLSNVVLPETLKKIGNGSFSYCLSLDEIVIPKSVTEVGEYAFDSCNNLKKICVENSSAKIGKGAFALTRCELLVDVDELVKSYVECYDNEIILRDADGFVIGSEAYPAPKNLNKMIKFKSSLVPVEDAIMYGYYDSTAHNYAKSNNLRFVAYEYQNEYATDIVSYLRGLLDKYISAFLKFIYMIKSLFGMA
ncbi:MAG: leucine-rich repeat domain-containing protein [Clostridia bacterium]|nr:leucine-rich repeat domain-containing protein [Clostridia bacterium]